MGEMDFQTWLGHDTRSGGGSWKSRLKGWKDRGEINVCLHTRAMFASTWRHALPRTFSKKDDETGEVTVQVWGGDWNCFAGETKFWANGQLVRFEEAVDKTVEVLAGDGQWRPAEVKRFGKQGLRRVVLKPYRVRSNANFEFVATPDHRWITSTRGGVTDLKPGDRVRVEPATFVRDSDDYKSGFVHGVIFGDGFRAERPGMFQIRLCGEKAALAMVLEDSPGYKTTSFPPSYNGDPCLRIETPDRDLKRIPDEEDPFAYQAGFLAGWLVVDGCDMGKGSPGRRLDSIDTAALEWIAERAPLLGFCVSGRGVSSAMETNYGRRSAPLGYVVLRPEPMEYSVKQIVDEGREDDVFCVVEPVTGIFTLEGGIQTGNCIEPEDVLTKQYIRDKKANERKYPPALCPDCKLIEWSRDAVASGEVKITQPLFRWEGSDPEHTRVITAGGIYNAFNKMNELPKEQQRECRRAGIRGDEAWMENMYAKCHYLFVVVDIDNPDEVQWSVEKQLLGEKMQAAIEKRMHGEGVEEGNPMINPVVFQWQYHPKAKRFNDKYDVVVMNKLKITDKVMKMITEDDPPSIRPMIAPGNVAKLRTSLEEHCVFDAIPFDDLFRAAEKWAEEKGQNEGKDERPSPGDLADDDSDPPEVGSDPPPKPAESKANCKPDDAPDVAVYDDDGNEIFACEKCDEPGLLADDVECKKCGAKYDPHTGALLPDEPEKKPPPKKARRRPKPAKSSGDGGWPDNKTDDIPF